MSQNKANEKSAPKKPRKKVAKKTEASAAPLMASTASHESLANTRTRRNKAGSIERTDKFKNIDDGLIPFKNNSGGKFRHQVNSISKN